MIPRQDLQKFANRAALLSFPLAVAMVIYVACDPFKVLWPYRFANYYDQAAPVEVNRDYVSLEMFLMNEPEQHYDSFIFGSSRSFPLHCETWQKHVPGMKPFHYPAASENLYGVFKKVKYLEESGSPLKNVIIETNWISLHDVSARRDHMHRLPRRLSGESWLEFQGGVLASYFQGYFFFEYGRYVVSGRVPASARNMLGIYPGMVRIDPLTNDYFFEAEERDLAENEEAFYAKRAALFRRAGPPPKCEPPAIASAQRGYLEAIREVFRRKGTSYRIVVPPVFEQECLNRDDLATLREIFGRENVFDFSGVNAWSADMHNFYDAHHVRPSVGDQILAALYAAPTPTE